MGGGMRTSRRCGARESARSGPERCVVELPFRPARGVALFVLVKAVARAINADGDGAKQELVEKRDCERDARGEWPRHRHRAWTSRWWKPVSTSRTLCNSACFAGMLLLEWVVAGIAMTTSGSGGAEQAECDVSAPRDPLDVDVAANGPSVLPAPLGLDLALSGTARVGAGSEPGAKRVRRVQWCFRQACVMARTGWCRLGRPRQHSLYVDAGGGQAVAGGHRCRYRQSCCRRDCFLKQVFCGLTHFGSDPMGSQRGGSSPCGDGCN